MVLGEGGGGFHIAGRTCMKKGQGYQKKKKHCSRPRSKAVESPVD